MKPVIKNIILLSLIVLVISCKNNKKNTSKNVKLTEKQQIEFSYFFYTAGKEKILGNIDEAAKLYRKCLQLDGKNTAALYELANIFYSTSDSKNAEFLCKVATQLDKKNEWYLLLYADILQKNRKYNDALKVRETLIKQYPGQIDFYYDYATALLYANKFDDAIEAYDKIEKMVGISEEIILQKQKIYIQLNKLEKAIAEMQKLIDSNPNEARYYGMLAELYKANNMHDQAFETYNNALKIDAENPYIHLSLSDYYRQKNEKDKSFSEIKTAFRSEELDIDTKVKILINYYDVSENSKEYKVQAYELIAILIYVHPKEAKTFSIQGDYYYRDGKLKEAREKFLLAISFDKSRLAIWEQLILIDNELDDYGSIIAHSKDALELFPNESKLYLFNGIANMQQKKYKEAIDMLTLGLALAVDDNKTLKGEFYAHLGDAYNRNKQFEESDKAYEKALEINPDNSNVLNNYSYYLSLRKEKLEKAAEMSKKSNELDKNNPSNQDTYGWILNELNKLDEAKIWIGKAVVNSENKNAVILEHYGDVLFKLGEIEKAVEFWQNAKLIGIGSDLLEKKINTKTLIE